MVIYFYKFDSSVTILILLNLEFSHWLLMCLVTFEGTTILVFFFSFQCFCMTVLIPHNGTFVSDYPSVLDGKYFVGGPYISPKLNFFPCSWWILPCLLTSYFRALCEAFSLFHLPGIPSSKDGKETECSSADSLDLSVPPFVPWL
jgi:hypothetical protein